MKMRHFIEIDLGPWIAYGALPLGVGSATAV
jgi:hypothetical protein